MDIDLYCERVAAGPWQEPLNTLSNLAFFLAAWGATRRLRSTNARDPFLQLAALLLVLIGFGSTLFHLFGTRETAVFDVLPIACFQILYLLLYANRVLRISAMSTGIMLLGFLGMLWGAQSLPAFNRSGAYFPAALMLFGFVTERRRTGRRAPRLELAAALFVVSLVFRTIDQALCPSFSIGTHFLWHLLNAAVLYLLFCTLPLKNAAERP